MTQASLLCTCQATLEQLEQQSAEADVELADAVAAARHDERQLAAEQLTEAARAAQGLQRKLQAARAELKRLRQRGLE